MYLVFLFFKLLDFRIVGYNIIRSLQNFQINQWCFTFKLKKVISFNLKFALLVFFLLEFENQYQLWDIGLKNIKCSPLHVEFENIFLY